MDSRRSDAFSDPGFDRAERLASLRAVMGPQGVLKRWPDILEQAFRKRQRAHRRWHRAAVFLLPWLLLILLPGFGTEAAALPMLGTVLVLLVSSLALVSLFLDRTRPGVQGLQAVAVGITWGWLLALRQLLPADATFSAVPLFALGLSWVLTALLAGFSWRRLAPAIIVTALVGIGLELGRGTGEANVALLGLSALFAVWAALNDERLYRSLWLEQEAGRVLTRVDALTGLANRPEWLFQLSRTLALARREDQPLALLLVDINDFQGLNTRYGHLAGDAALRQLAHHLEPLRVRHPADVLARIGADQFGLACYGVTEAMATALAEALRCNLRTLEIEGPAPGGRERLDVTVAVMATAVADGWSPDRLQMAVEGRLREIRGREGWLRTRWSGPDADEAPWTREAGLPALGRAAA